MNIQKKIVRLMTYNSYLEHIKPIFEDLNILHTFKINDFLTATFMFGHNQLKILPAEFDRFFVASNQIHQHNTKRVKTL